jgi:hypothetical protein
MDVLLFSALLLAAIGLGSGSPWTMAAGVTLALYCLAVQVPCGPADPSEEEGR